MTKKELAVIESMPADKRPLLSVSLEKMTEASKFNDRTYSWKDEKSKDLMTNMSGYRVQLSEWIVVSGIKLTFEDTDNESVLNVEVCEGCDISIHCANLKAENILSRRISEML